MQSGGEPNNFSQGDAHAAFPDSGVPLQTQPQPPRPQYSQPQPVQSSVVQPQPSQSQYPEPQYSQPQYPQPQYPQSQTFQPQFQPQSPSQFPTFSANSGDIILATDQPKSRRAPIIALVILSVILVITGIGFVVWQATNSDSTVSVANETISNDDLGQRIIDIGSNLKKLSNKYNQIYSPDETETGQESVSSAKNIIKSVSNYIDIKNLVNQMPLAAQTNLDNRSQQTYTELLDEVRQRLSILKKGLELSIKFDYAFFWPIEEGKTDAAESDFVLQTRASLLNSKNPNIKKTAEILQEFYVKSVELGDSLESIPEETYDEILNSFYSCFQHIDNPDDFNDKLINFARSIKS